MTKLLAVSAILIVILLATLFAQEKKEDGAAGSGQGDKKEAFTEKDRVIIGRRWLRVEIPCGELKLKAWLLVPPGSDTQKTPAVLRIPAGGSLFTPAILGLGTVPEIEPYFTAGYVTLVMSFRDTLANGGKFSESKGGLEDVLAALEYLRKLPEVDPKNIYVAGHSSAASLALRVAQVSDVPRAVAAFSPVTDWTEFFKERMENLSEESRKYLEDASAVNHVGQTKCPVLLTHGTKDTIAPISHSEVMAGKLKELEKPCEFVRIPEGDHYFSMLKVGIPLSLAFFSEMREHGKTTELYTQFRDNLLKKYEESLKAGGE
jgi:dipeptidyl aminopeptidase/acylaminoacyl peptidase